MEGKGRDLERREWIRRRKKDNDGHRGREKKRSSEEK